MVAVEFTSAFEKRARKIRHQTVKEQVKKLIRRIVEFPEIGKPMMHSRKGTREIYVSLFQFSYAYLKDEGKIIFLDLYHKDQQ